MGSENLRSAKPSPYLVGRVDELIRLALAGDVARVKFARKRLLQYLAAIEHREYRPVDFEKVADGFVPGYEDDHDDSEDLK